MIVVWGRFRLGFLGFLTEICDLILGFLTEISIVCNFDCVVAFLINLSQNTILPSKYGPCGLLFPISLIVDLFGVFD